MSTTITLYPLSNFTFSTKEAQPEEDPSVQARLQRLQNNYEDFGMRRTVEGVLVVHDHGHPHILMLQIANAFFKLPGDYLKPGEDETNGLKSRLNDRLAPLNMAENPEEDDWEIGDCLAQWWRPNFETFMYPYVPPHVTKPKECKKLFMVQMPEKKVLAVPKNMKLLAIPLFELYDNAARYGPQLSAIPHLLSRLSPAAWDGEGAQAVFSSFAIQFSFLATKGKQSVVRCETQSNSYSPMKFNKSSQKYLAAIGWYLTRFQHFTTCPGMSYIVLKNPVAGLDSLEGPPN